MAIRYSVISRKSSSPEDTGKRGRWEVIMVEPLYILVQWQLPCGCVQHLPREEACGGEHTAPLCEVDTASADVNNACHLKSSNVLQHQIQSCLPVKTWDSLGLHVLAPEVVGSEKPCTFTTSLCHHAMYCIWQDLRKTLKLQQDIGIGVADQQRHGNKVGIIA